jgi:hypothetical protein
MNHLRLTGLTVKTVTVISVAVEIDEVPVYQAQCWVFLHILVFILQLR